MFDKKIYRLDQHKGATYHFNLNDVEGVTLEGNGAEIINNPYNSIISIDNCSDVNMRNFKFDCYPLPFTQGTITEVDAEKGVFFLKMLSKSPDSEIEFTINGTDILLIPYYQTGSKQSGPRTYFKL